MLYSLNNKNELIECFGKNYSKNIHFMANDMWGFALSFCYNNRVCQTESVLCSPNIKNHIQILKLLYLKSAYLKRFTHFYSVTSPEQEILEYNMTRKGNLVFYNSEPTTENAQSAFGLLFFPEYLSDYQKCYLERYQDSLLQKRLYIYKLKKETDELDELTQKSTPEKIEIQRKL